MWMAGASCISWRSARKSRPPITQPTLMSPRGPPASIHASFTVCIAAARILRTNHHTTTAHAHHTTRHDTTRHDQRHDTTRQRVRTKLASGGDDEDADGALCGIDAGSAQQFDGGHQEGQGLARPRLARHQPVLPCTRGGRSSRTVILDLTVRVCRVRVRVCRAVVRVSCGGERYLEEGPGGRRAGRGSYA